MSSAELISRSIDKRRIRVTGQSLKLGIEAEDLEETNPMSNRLEIGRSDFAAHEYLARAAGATFQVRREFDNVQQWVAVCVSDSHAPPVFGDRLSDVFERLETPAAQ